MVGTSRGERAEDIPNVEADRHPRGLPARPRLSSLHQGVAAGGSV